MIHVYCTSSRCCIDQKLLVSSECRKQTIAFSSSPFSRFSKALQIQNLTLTRARWSPASSLQQWMLHTIGTLLLHKTHWLVNAFEPCRDLELFRVCWKVIGCDEALLDALGWSFSDVLSSINVLTVWGFSWMCKMIPYTMCQLFQAEEMSYCNRGILH